MVLKCRVNTHGFHSDGKTSISLVGLGEDASSSFNVVRDADEAAKYPVGSSVSVTIKPETK